MSRLRIMEPGGMYHLTQRGNNRVAVFNTDADRRVYLKYLEQYSREEQCLIHAYCLMGNHVHLVLTASSGEAVSRLMCQVQGRYARHFNRTWHRSGSLWSKRFHHVQVESEGHLLSCLMYLDYNPVEARLCSAPAAYPWSSHRRYAAGRPDSLLTPPGSYLAMGPTEAKRQQVYVRAVEDYRHQKAALAMAV